MAIASKLSRQKGKITSNFVVILYGPPGSGKGTQAELLEKNLHFIHFDTGRQLRSIFSDSKNKKSKEIQKEKKLNDTGRLNTPSWVLKIIKKKSEELFKLGQPIIFSGSPRTFFEAFGDKKNEGFLSFLEKKIGKKNIFIFILKIPEKTSIFRNSNRVYCNTCHSTFLAKYKNLKECPFCEGKIIRRKDDNKKIITKRLEEYQERTLPVFKELKKRKYKIYEVDGTFAPGKIFNKIITYLK